MNERALVLGSERSLVGIASYPPRDRIDPARPALIVLNAGHVHRVGPQRLHVVLTRRLARRGFVAMRFDFSGIGDSLPRADSLPFEKSSVLEVREVMDAMAELMGIDKFCVIGLSSGALVSLASAVADPRIVGVCMINPHGFAESAQWAKHVDTLSESRIYARNIFHLDSWRRLLSGRTNYRRLGRALWYKATRPRRRPIEISSVVAETRPVLMEFLGLDIHTLMLFSEKDRSIENFDEILDAGWQGRVGGKVKVVAIPDANHTFANPIHLHRAVAAIEEWMTGCWPAELKATAQMADYPSSRTVAGG